MRLKGKIIKYSSLVLAVVVSAFGSVTTSPGGLISNTLETGGGEVVTTISNAPVAPSLDDPDPIPTPIPLGPANDDFAAAFPLTAVSNTIPVSNFGATLQEDEPTETLPGRKTVWFTWILQKPGRCYVGSASPPAIIPPRITNVVSVISGEPVFNSNGSITFTNSDYLINYHNVFTVDFSFLSQPPPPTYVPHAVYSVYSGDQLTNLVQIGRGTSVVFEAEAGQNYAISMEGDGLTTELAVEMNVVQFPAPSNDLFANALAITNASSFVMIGYAASATYEPGEPRFTRPYIEITGSSWFSWTAPTYGQVTIGSGSPVFLYAVFSGSSVSNLNLIASNFQSVEFFAQEGVTYSIAIYSRPEVGVFAIPFSGPQIRVFDTTTGALFPRGLYPLLSGVNGSTAYLYARRGSEWVCLEIEPIINGKTSFVRRPLSSDTDLRITTIDAQVPPPRLDASNGVPKLRGLPGQRCRVSTSEDLITWQPLGEFVLNSKEFPLRYGLNRSTNTYFRVTQAVPVRPNP